MGVSRATQRSELGWLGIGYRVVRERPIGEATFARWWRGCCERARVSYRNPQVCRHTYATRWLRDGGRMNTLAKALGHSSIRTTVDLYAHLATEDVAADLARVIAARETRLRDQSAAETRMNTREEAPSGFEPLSAASTVSTHDRSETLDALTQLLRQFRGDGGA